MSDDLTRATCPHCRREVTYYKRHAGFADEGYMYCSSDEVILVWSFYGPSKYRQIVDELPWKLDDEGKARVEAALRPCPFGGTFSFRNPPRCPHCSRDISAVVPGGIYYIVTGRRVDGDKEEAWK